MDWDLTPIGRAQISIEDARGPFLQPCARPVKRLARPVVITQRGENHGAEIRVALREIRPLPIAVQQDLPGSLGKLRRGSAIPHCQRRAALGR